MITENLNPPDEPRTKPCPNCTLGTGWQEPETCETCNGEGEIIIDDKYFDGDAECDEPTETEKN